MIGSRDQLAALVVRALRCTRVGLDTEFFWERTFYPRLGLVQLALEDGEVALIDPLEQPSLDLLGVLLVAPAVQKILHDGAQDLAILRRACGCAAPRNIFDTRVAAGFCGRSSTASLQDLLADYGVELQKDVQRNDWTRRPLSARELDYARADVEHLIRLATDLEQDACARGNEAWLAEELATFDAPEVTEERDPRACYLRVKGKGRLAPQQLAALVELAAWREEEARRRDRPRGHIVTDRDLLATAAALPRDLEGLPNLGPKEQARYGERMLVAVARAVQREEGQAPSQVDEASGDWRTRKSAKVSERADALITLVDEMSAARGIDSALVASRSSLRSLAGAGEHASAEEFPLLSGWRAELLGDALHTLLRG